MYTNDLQGNITQRNNFKPMPDFKPVLMNTTQGEEIQPDRPEPTAADILVVHYKRRMDPQFAVEALVEGYHVLIIDFYSSGLVVLNALKQYVNEKFPDQSFQGQRDARSAFRELSNHLLLKVNNHRLVVRKAPVIGWLKILYPGLNDFLLTFPQVQGLNSAWQWYEKGIFIPVLKRKIHPWFGTYFPTRFEHLELFEHWLKLYKGDSESAVDVGIGSGVLAFQMLKQGFRKVYGTDTNPNAVIGLREEQQKTNHASGIELCIGDLFAECGVKTELIVFNPPWLPASQQTDGLDNAIYYAGDLFSRFFAEAEKHLQPGGRVVILFSNLAQISGVVESHPVVAELEGEGRFKKELFLQKKVRPGSKNTKRNLSRRSDEIVELWVLKLRD